MSLLLMCCKPRLCAIQYIYKCLISHVRYIVAWPLWHASFNCSLFLQWHRDHGIDTLLTGQGSAHPCGSSTPGSVIAGQLAPKYNFYVLAQPDIPLKDIRNKSNVLGMFLSDESDTHVSWNLY